MRKEQICITAGKILRPPDAPIANHDPPLRVAMMGHMLVRGRFPGAIQLGDPGRGSNHIMPLFIRMPEEGSTTLEPNTDSRVCVSATMLPCRSTTFRCVVLVCASVSA